MSRRVVLTVAMVVALVTLCALSLSAYGEGGRGAGDDEDKDNQSASGGATRNGQIAFRRNLDVDVEQENDVLFTMNPDGTHVSQITHPPKGWHDEHPEWSPDGTKVTFYRQNAYRSRIMVLNLQTGHTREVTHCGPDQGWTKEKTKEHPPPYSGRYCVEDLDPAFSPDGRSIAFHRLLSPDPWNSRKFECCRIEGIWIIGLDGSNPHQVTNVDPKLPEAYHDIGPAFSPDGKMLVFDRVRDVQKAPKLVKLGEEDPYYHAVFVQSLDSSGEPEDAHRITPWKMNCQSHPEFSPDGKLVLFRCAPKGDEGEGPSNLYWVHPDGTGLHALTHEDADKQYGDSSFSPSFHKGEGWIAVGRTNTGYGKSDADSYPDVFRIRIEHGDMVRSVDLTKSVTWDSLPGWGTHPPAD
jgi:Tol biopolymer transport system component